MKNVFAIFNYMGCQENIEKGSGNFKNRIGNQQGALRTARVAKIAFGPAFITAVIDQAEPDRYFLTKHFHSAQSTEAEREAFVPDGAGGFYVAINPRDEAPTTTVADTVPKRSQKAAHVRVPADPSKKAVTGGFNFKAVGILDG